MRTSSSRRAGVFMLVDGWTVEFNMATSLFPKTAANADMIPLTDSRREEPSTNRSLLNRARSGEEEGWRMLVQIYGPLVYRWIRRCGIQSADAADVMQETLLAVATALPGFDSDRSDASFRGWLWTIARNKLRDRRRASKARGEINGSGADVLIDQAGLATFDAEQPPTDVADDARLTRLRTLECLRRTFDPRSWRMFWETTVTDRDPADVAEEMGV